MAKKLNKQQRDFLRPALDKLDAAVKDLEHQLRHLPPNGGGEGGGTGCFRCDCGAYLATKGKPNAPCRRKVGGQECGHPFSSHNFI
jgi:hypothetical protein